MAYRKDSTLFPKISRRKITHLFWGEYPYKIETTYPAKGWKPLPYGYHTGANLDIQKVNRENYTKKVDSFRRMCLKYVPYDEKVWKLYETNKSFHFYFLNSDDMDRFVSANEKIIRAIYEPASNQDLNFLKKTDNKNTFLRLSLFYNKYRFCVVFKNMKPDVKKELDNWVNAIFGDESDDRFSYNNFGSRFLYLNAENDIMMTRLAFNQYILDVNKVILRTEIDENGISEEIN